MKSYFVRSLLAAWGVLLLAPWVHAYDKNFPQAYGTFARGDYASALPALAQVKSSPDQPLHDYYLWALGRSRLEIGDAAGGKKALEELLKHERESLWYFPAKIQLARALRELGQAAEAQKSLETLLSELPESLKGEALLQIALSEAVLGKKEAAQARFRELEIDYPASAAAKEVSPERKKLGLPNPSLTPTELSRRADRLFEAKSYTAALSAYEELLQNPGSENTALARVNKGECLYALRRYSAAIPWLDPSANVPAEAARTARIHRGMSLLRSGSDAGAIAEFEKVQSLYPGTPEGEEALYRAGMISHQAGNFSKAAVFFDRLAQSYPQGNFRDKALWASAWAAYRKSDWAEADRWLEAMQQGATDDPTRGKALYWQGRVAERRGDKAKAESYWKAAGSVASFSYYGFMALKQLQNSEDLSKTPKVPPEWTRPASAPPGGDLKTAAEFHFRKAVALADGGLGRFSLAELETAVEKSEGDPKGKGRLLDLAKTSDAYFIPLQLGQKYWDQMKIAFADPKNAEQFRVYLQFPFAYRSLVEKEAKARSLPPALVVALMRQESAFMPWVSSSANARGLMQLLPTTAAGRAKAAGIPSGDLFDPAYNVQVGTAELKAMLERFSNNWILAFSAYNAGPGRARAWSESFGHLKPDEFTEEIPFSETNLYVKLVLRNYWSYRTLYP